jgi:hypothetical protein
MMTKPLEPGVGATGRAVIRRRAGQGSLRRAEDADRLVRWHGAVAELTRDEPVEPEGG